MRRTDQILQAVGPAVHLAAGDLYGPEILDDAHHGVEAVARQRVLAPHEFTLLVVFPPVAKHGHEQIVHSFDLDHTRLQGKGCDAHAPIIYGLSMQSSQGSERSVRSLLSNRSQRRSPGRSYETVDPGESKRVDGR